MCALNIATASRVITVDGVVIIHQIQDSECYNYSYIACKLLLYYVFCTEIKLPTMRDINRYVTRRHAVDWKNIDIELGLKLAALNIIENDHPLKSEACFQVMIDKWIEKIAENATWKALEVALTNVNRQKLDLDPVDDVYGMGNVNIAIVLLYVGA